MFKARWCSFAFIVLSITSFVVNAQPLLFSLHNQSIVQCSGDNDELTPPDFSGADCKQVKFGNIDPQNNMIWLKFSVPQKSIDNLIKEFTDEERGGFPLGIFVMGKAASRIFFNGTLIGKNGIPAKSKPQEVVGLMDYVAYLPEGLVLPANNELIIHMSSHHGLLTLRQPVHFVGIGEFFDSKKFVQQTMHLGLVLLGVFVLSAFYFGNLLVRLKDKINPLLFMLMSVFAAGQLLAELSRGLFDYHYPSHDIRLILVVFFGICVGLSLLAHICIKFGRQYSVHWFYGGALVTLGSVFAVVAFDAKATLAVIVPICISSLMVSLHMRREFSQNALRHLFVLVGFLVVFFPTYRYFHEILFYVILAILYLFLFAQHALDYARESEALQDERALRAKLELRIEQTHSLDSAQTINIESAGKIEKVRVADILYCKANGDYVDVITSKRAFLASGSLKKMLECLPSSFIKVHRSFVVNLNQVTALQRDNDNGLLLLGSEHQVPVSRRMLPSVRESISAS